MAAFTGYVDSILITSKNYTTGGEFALSLFVKGIQLNVTVDDLLPINATTSTFAFAQSVNDVVWP